MLYIIMHGAKKHMLFYSFVKYLKYGLCLGLRYSAMLYGLGV